MKRTLLLAVLLVALAGAFAVLRKGRQTLPNAPVAAAVPEPEKLIVGPGRVEPESEEVHVAAEIGGRLQSVLVEEGSRIQSGDTLAEIQSSDYRARVQLAEAEAASRQAELQRVISGARPEERREAASAVKQAEATLSNARAELRRYQALFADRLTAREELDRRETAATEAEARLETARQHSALVEATARVEDRERAEAQLQLAQAALAEARSELDKTTIHAPISGVVLRRHFRTGETVHAGEAIVTIGDISRLRVRMELDERDVGRVGLGLSAYCTAGAYGDQRFPGKIVQIGQMLGRKNIHTDEPAERADTKVLEALIELEPGTRLRPGLRVDVFVRPGK